MNQLIVLGEDPQDPHRRLLKCPACSRVRSIKTDSARQAELRGHSLCHACSVRRSRMIPIEDIPGWVIIIEQIAATRYESMHAMALVECPDCGKQFLKSRNDVRGRTSTMCRPCARARKRGPAHHNWRGGQRYRRTGMGWETLAESIRERDEYTCQHCGRLSGYDLHVHHIVPYRESPDNSVYNLISLCRSCHTWADMNLDQSIPILSTVINWYYDGA